MSFAIQSEVCVIVVGAAIAASGSEYAWFRAIGPAEDVVVAELVLASKELQKNQESERFYIAAEHFKHRTYYRIAIGSAVIACSAFCCVMHILRRVTLARNEARAEQQATRGELRTGGYSRIAGTVVICLQLVICLISLFVFVLMQPSHISALAGEFRNTAKSYPSDRWEAVFAEQVRVCSSIPLSPPIPYRVGVTVIVLSAICLGIDWLTPRCRKMMSNAMSERRWG